MKAGIYKDEGCKRMAAAFEVYNEQGSGLAERPQPGGLPDISRGLSATKPPEHGRETNRTLEGCQNSSAVLSRIHLLESLAPLRATSPLHWPSGGVASLCSAQPP